MPSFALGSGYALGSRHALGYALDYAPLCPCCAPAVPSQVQRAAADIERERNLDLERNLERNLDRNSERDLAAELEAEQRATLQAVS